MFLSAALVLLLVLQESDEEVAQRWVEKLRSSEPAEREEATHRLKEMGRRALPVLERAAQDPDAEVAGRAAELCRLVEIVERVTNNLRRILPGIEELLAKSPHAATKVFLDLLAMPDQTTVTRQDFEALLPDALERARTKEERTKILLCIQTKPVHSVVPTLKQFLKDRDPDIRVEAIETLRCLGAVYAAQELLSSLDDPAPGVRAKAAYTLGCFLAHESIPKLFKLLQDGDENVRWCAMNALVKLRPPNAEEEIRPLLKDESASVRRDAIKALTELGCRNAYLEIIKLVRDEADDVRMAVVEVLGLWGGKEAETCWPVLLADRSADIREQALEKVALLELKEAIPSVRRLLKDENADVRQEAIATLGMLQAREAIPEIEERCVDEDDLVRLAAAWALITLGEQSKALPAVRSLLRSPNLEVVGKALMVLQLCDPREFNPSDLEGLLDQKDPDIRKYAISLIRYWKARQVLPKMIPLLRDESSKVQVEVIKTMKEWDVREVIPELRRLLDDPEADVRYEVVEALQWLDVSEIAVRLVPLLKDDDVQWAAICALEDLGGAEVVPPLMKLLTDEDPEVRFLAARVLCTLEVKEAAPDLSKMLRAHAYEDFRVAFALAEWGWDEWVQEMKAMLDHESEGFQNQAAYYLTRLGRWEGVPRILAQSDKDAVKSWLFNLNAVRQPKAWAQLKEKKLTKTVEGSLDELCKQLAAEAGFQCDVSVEEKAFSTQQEKPPLLEWVENDDSNRKIRILSRRGRKSILEALDEGLGRHRYDVILEEDRIRLLDREEAVEFWKSWWSKEQHK